ncbi:hypothetical protein [Clostridium intestinale]|uniref:hypothetical protein n=1 Tax=Clostridium intestinale TaxID=36845 RepID=UPI0028E4C0B1|nr:hypothetical protein [Clostridium intestinale]
MENLLTLIWEWRYVFLYALGVIAFAVFQGKQWIKCKAYAFMLLAKSKAKDGILNSGQAQEDWAVEALYILLKKLKIPFVTEETVRAIVKKLYVLAKDYLDDGKINISISK